MSFFGKTALEEARSAIKTVDSIRDQGKSFSLAGSKSTGSGSQPGAYHQSERLFTLRPRSTPLTNKNEYTSDRGPYSSIKLLTDRKKEDVISQTGASDNKASAQSLDYVVEKLLSEDGYADFLVTQIGTALDEKVQINEVFGDAEVVYYFGKSPVIFSITGILTDDIDNNWFYNFITAYGSVLRGTQLAKNYQLVQINLPNMTLVGSISGLRYNQDAARDIEVGFQMSIIVKSMTPRPVSLPAEILSNQAVKLNLNKAREFDLFRSKAQINSLSRKLNSAKAYLGSTLGMAESSASKYITGLGDTISGAIGEASGFFDEMSSGLFSVAELRANIFSPVYGVLTTLTKVVSSLTGDISSILSGASNPLSTILKDIRTISNEALSVINVLEGGLSDIIRTPESIAADIRKTIRALENTAGAISRAPEDLSNILKRLTKLGRKKGHIASLKSGRVNRSKAALLASGKPYTGADGAKIDK